MKNLSKVPDLRMNLKASLAAPDVNVIKEDDGDLDSSSSDEAERKSNAGSGSLIERKLSNKMNPRKVSDVRSEDF
jgi:hypothetical protein